MDRRTFLALIGVGAVGSSAAIANSGDVAAAAGQPGKKISVSEDGSVVVKDVSDINFGTGVVAVDDGDGTVTVTASGGGGSHPISHDSIQITSAVGDVDFRDGLDVIDDGDNTVGILIPSDGIVADMIATDQVGLDELDLSIAPTWTASHTWQGAIQNFERAEPGAGSVIFKRLIDSTSGDELRWKLTTSGIFKVVIFDSSAGVERDLWQVDPATGEWQQLATLSFPNITGAPTFATHDHSETGLAQIVTGGIADEAITEPKLDALDTPNDAEILAWNAASSRFEWITPSAGSALAVEEDGTQLTADASVLNFAAGLTATEPTPDEIDIALAIDIEDSGVDVIPAHGINFGANLSVTDDGDDTVTVDASGGGGGGQNHMSVSIPHTEWASGLSSVEVHRLSLVTGETLEVYRLDVKLKTGGTLAGLTFDVFDETNTTVLASTSDLVQGSPIATSGDGADVIIRISNSTGNFQVASCEARLVVVDA